MLKCAWRLALGVLLGCLPGMAAADPEIMVHEADLADRGELVASIHANHAWHGQRRSDDGTWPAHRLTYLMAEFATGLAPGWEAGLHLPVMRGGVDSEVSDNGAWGASAIMFRLKHIRQAGEGWFYGFNAEYDINARRYVRDPRGAEFRGIVGFDGERVRLTANPHLMWGWGREGSPRSPDLNLDLKALYKVSEAFAWGVEAYTDGGRVNRLRPGEGDRTVYLVTEFETRAGAVHLGVGQGFKETPERYLLKGVWTTRF
jgi:hypothetical protein